MTVLCVNCAVGEAADIHRLVAPLGEEARLSPPGADAPPSGERPRLVVLRVGDESGDPAAAVRHLRDTFGSPVLCLIPPARKNLVRGLLRAGAEDYWLLPITGEGLAARLAVLIEWGKTPPPRLPPPLRRLASALKRLAGRLFRPPPPQDLIARRWRKVRRLGLGSFGEAWLVEDTRTLARAVAKIPLEASMNRRSLEEAAILSRLDHPNAPRLIAVANDEGRAVIIEEYAEGRTLAALLEAGLPPAARERAYLRLLDVLAHAHSLRIAHRDVKPENIVLSPEGALKLLDFGTAKDATRADAGRTVIGSRPWMAPEQIEGQSAIESDVWALGAVLYALATGVLPFFHENEKVLMDMILETDPPPPRAIEPAVPEALEALIMRCLEKDPKRRYPDAGALRGALLGAFPEFGEGRVLPGGAPPLHPARGSAP